MHTLTTGLATLALAAGLLAGCGGDDDDGTAAPGDGATTTAAPAEDGRSEEAFCAEIEAVQGRFDELATSGDLDPAMFDEVAEAFDDIAARAPEEIAPDVDALGGALRSLSEVLGDLDPGAPGAMAELQERAGALQDQAAELQASAAAVQAYVADTCGIEVDGADGAPGAPPTTAG